MSWKKDTNNKQQVSWSSKNGFITITNRFQKGNAKWKVYATRNDATTLETSNTLSKFKAENMAINYMRANPNG